MSDSVCTLGVEILHWWRCLAIEPQQLSCASRLCTRAHSSALTEVIHLYSLCALFERWSFLCSSCWESVDKPIAMKLQPASLKRGPVHPATASIPRFDVRLHSRALRRCECFAQQVRHPCQTEGWFQAIQGCHVPTEACQCRSMYSSLGVEDGSML